MATEQESEWLILAQIPFCGCRSGTFRQSQGFRCHYRAAHPRAANSQFKTTAPARLAPSWAAMKAGADCGAMPAKLSVKDRATVTAGLAKLVEAVNQ